MRLLKAINDANEMRPNAIDDAVKAEWIYSLEGDISEMYGVPAPVCPFPADAELLSTYPYDDIYVLYLCAMIDNAQQDTGLYANDMSVANAAITRARSAYRRAHIPPDKGNWRIGI